MNFFNKVFFRRGFKWELFQLLFINLFIIVFDYFLLWLIYIILSEEYNSYFNSHIFTGLTESMVIKFLYILIIIRALIYIFVKKRQAKNLYQEQHNIFKRIVLKLKRYNPAESDATLSTFHQLLVSDCQTMVMYLYMPVLNLIVELISVIFLFLIIFFTSKYLFTFILGFGLILFFYFKYTARINQIIGERRRNYDKERMNEIYEFIYGYFDYKQYHRLEDKVSALLKYDKYVADANVRQVMLGDISRPLIESMAYLLLISLFLVFSKSDYMNTSGLLFVLAMLMRTLPSFQKINNSLDMLKYGLKSRDNLLNYLTDSEEEVLTQESQTVLLADHSGLRIESLEKDFLLKRIKYTDFDFDHGKMYLVRGRSGVGKSTMLKIISGIIPASIGKVVHKNSKNNFHRIAYVGQEVFLFKGTVRDNIAFGLEVCETVALSSLRLAGLEKELTLDDTIEDNGKNLSGGQRQRVVIARALLVNSDVLILDESITGLDENVQLEILGTLKNLALESRLVIVSIHSTKFDNLFDNVYEMT